MDTNNYDLQLEIKQYLDVNEDILWCDKPFKKITFSSGDVFTTLFGVVWLSFSLFWVASAFFATKGAAGFAKVFPLFGIPFVLIGLYLLFFRHIVSYIRRKNMIYTLTSKRVMIVHTGKRQYVQEYRYEDISNIQIKCDDNDVGSIFFFSGEIRYNNGKSYSSTSGIFGIKNTKKVYKILSQCLERKKK
ncbi:MAG: DUF308 domain-containing protein [Clostridia bacterium]|nr:DUF308 domain-containing protein [Clostridia bacterium]